MMILREQLAKEIGEDNVDAALKVFAGWLAEEETYSSNPSEDTGGYSAFRNRNKRVVFYVWR